MSDPLRLTVGVHDIPESAYHADPTIHPSLSNSLAKVFLDYCPLRAWLEHPRLNPNFVRSVPTKEMEFGSLGHKLLLGKGADIDVCSKNDWKTDFAQGFRDDSRKNGRIPVLQKTLDKANAFTAGVQRELERLGIWSDFKASKKEQTYIWTQDDCYLRCMIDSVLVDESTCTVNIFDLKCVDNASPEACFRQIPKMHYDLQEHFQIRAVQNAFPHLAGRIKHLFVFAETEFPFLVTPVELTGEGKHLGLGKFQVAFEQWKACTHTGKWPGYSQGVVSWTPKPWDSKRIEEALGVA